MNINEYAANSRVDRIMAIIQALRENIPMTPGGFLKDYTDELHNEAAELRVIVNKDASKPVSARDAITRMRDEFVLLVLAYNMMEQFTSGMHAQNLAVSLDDFLARHGRLEAIRWPAEVISGQDGWANRIVAVDGSELETGDIT